MQGQAAIKNGDVAEANSCVVDLAAFNTKATILAALQHGKKVKQTSQVRFLLSRGCQEPSEG